MEHLKDGLDLISYNPTTGKFYWKKDKGRAKAGDEVGYTNSAGYRYTKINQKEYPLHKLAFVLMGQEYPHGDVDHINRVKSDNRWENLRTVSRQQNVWNTGPRKNNILQEKHIRKIWGKYQVRVDGKSLGVFTFLEDAIAVRDQYVDGQRA